MLIPKDEFIGLEGVCHLATGGQPPLLRAHRRAYAAFEHDKAIGMAGYERHWEVGLRVKAQLAAMTGLEPGDFGLLGNASEGIVRAVSAIPWQAGDNAVSAELDYKSGRAALAMLGGAGVALRLVPPVGWETSEQAILAACDGRTRLVYVSHVNAHTGQRADLAALSAALRPRGIALLVDASHSIGAIPVPGRCCDFLVASTYKFLLSPHAGVFAWNRRAWPDFAPQAAGWHSTEAEAPGRFAYAEGGQRAEIGNSNHLTVYLMEESLKVLAAVEATALERHILGLTGELRRGMTALGLELLTPEAEAARGPNVCFAHPAPRAVADLAAGDGILLWGEAGRLRASAHGFVSGEDVAQFLAWLPEGLSAAGKL